MFTLAGFSESQDNAAAFANMAAIVDRYHKVNGDFITIGEHNLLFGAMACLGATVPGRGYLSSPTLRRHNQYEITPVEHDIHPGAKIHGMWHPNSPIPLSMDETLEALSNSNPAAPEQHAIMIWLADSPISPVNGKMITIHFQITLAQVVNTWQYSEITLSEDLPVGEYSCVGGRIIADGGIAARFIPVGGKGAPGMPCVATSEEDGDELFRHGRLGEWFKFHTTSLPGVELLGSAAVASATYDGYMDILIP